MPSTFDPPSAIDRRIAALTVRADAYERNGRPTTAEVIREMLRLLQADGGSLPGIRPSAILIPWPRRGS